MPGGVLWQQLRKGYVQAVPMFIDIHGFYPNEQDKYVLIIYETKININSG
jgi:hypothetical protein